ncbi:hypothetical protein KIN20_027471 [Parelaphostrongylus tenuis]|uniref:Uncharacterized protein n=1 Tax=Parelaphostrongylus tenuis TaxID=148309 RepID=A0AAD5QZQ3_PARTN|nr:hypothetical protein KIN20_027471 [Parelaphostrongylus tenuis]
MTRISDSDKLKMTPERRRPIKRKTERWPVSRGVTVTDGCPVRRLEDENGTLSVITRAVKNSVGKKCLVAIDRCMWRKTSWTTAARPTDQPADGPAEQRTVP